MKLPAAFGKYLLTDLIACGGMATVYRAKAFGAGGFEKIVAIKKIHPHLSLDHEFVNMFIDEARIASNLTHPNIVQIFDLGRIENCYFIAMEYVDGVNLDRLNALNQKNGKKISTAAATFIIRETANALHYAHTRNGPDGKPMEIVHRDISPQNIIISRDGIVKLTDFGVAKARLRLSHTQPGMTKGKYPYMSPEQVEGKELDSKSDIFSLCSVFYEIVTGRPAFSGDTEFEIMESVKKSTPTTPSRLNPSIPSEIERIILKGLNKIPSQRFDSASELSNALTGFLRKEGLQKEQDEIRVFIQNTTDDALSDKQHSKVQSGTLVLEDPDGIRKRVRALKILPGILTICLAVTLFAYWKYAKNKTHDDKIINTASGSAFEQEKTGVPEKANLSKIEKAPSPHTAQPSPARLDVNAYPWAYVFIDGRKIGETPVVGLVLSEGEHVIVLESPGARVKLQKTVHLRSGENIKLFGDFNNQSLDIP